MELCSVCFLNPDSVLIGVLSDRNKYRLSGPVKMPPHLESLIPEHVSRLKLLTLLRTLSLVLLVGFSAASSLKSAPQWQRHLVHLVSCSTPSILLSGIQ